MDSNMFMRYYTFIMIISNSMDNDNKIQSIIDLPENKTMPEVKFSADLLIDSIQSMENLDSLDISAYERLGSILASTARYDLVEDTSEQIDLKEFNSNLVSGLVQSLKFAVKLFPEIFDGGYMEDQLNQILNNLQVVDVENDNVIYSIAKSINSVDVELVEGGNRSGASDSRLILSEDHAPKSMSLAEDPKRIFQCLHVILHESKHVDLESSIVKYEEDLAQSDPENKRVVRSLRRLKNYRDQMPHQLVELFPDLIAEIFGFPNVPFSKEGGTNEYFEDQINKSDLSNLVGIESSSAQSRRVHLKHALYNDPNWVKRDSEFIPVYVGVDSKLQSLFFRGYDPERLYRYVYKNFGRNLDGTNGESSFHNFANALRKAEFAVDDSDTPYSKDLIQAKLKFIRHLNEVVILHKLNFLKSV
jgi:hypothetical protein